MSKTVDKLGCVVRMVVHSILPHAECGPNDHRKDAPPFIGDNFGMIVTDKVTKIRNTVID